MIYEIVIEDSDEHNLIRVPGIMHNGVEGGSR
jgi:hypothetical protein